MASVTAALVIALKVTGLLGVHQVAGDLARVVHGGLDGARRDLGEDHPVQGAVLEQAAFLQDLGDVPADRLALAIRVSGQVDGGGGLGGLGDGLDVLLVLLDQLVAHREPVVRVHRAFLGYQVANVAVRGQDVEVLAQVLVDRLGLGGRFDDEEVLGHAGACSRADPLSGRPDGEARGERGPGGLFSLRHHSGRACQAKARARGGGRFSGRRWAAGCTGRPRRCRSGPRRGPGRCTKPRWRRLSGRPGHAGSRRSRRSRRGSR